MQRHSLLLIKILLALAFVVELGMITYWRKSWGDYGSPMLWFVAALLTALLPLLWTAYSEGPQSLLKSPPRWRKFLLPGVALAGLLCVAPLLPPVFEVMPLTVDNSDITPQIRVLVQRFLRGEMPYQPITDWGYELFSPYMPLQWLPFVLPEVAGFDYRWMAYAVFLLAAALFALYLSRLELPLALQLSLAATPALFLWLLTNPLHFTILGRTVELLIAGYYLLLALSILSQSDAVRALGLLLCLLSKYVILFWLPLYALAVLLYDRKSSALRIALFVAGGLLLLYVLPFMTRDPAIFMKGYAYHQQVTFGLWHPMYWQPPDAKPFLLFEGMGFAGWFYDTLSGGIAEKQRILGLVQWGGSLAVVILSGLWFYVHLHKKLGYRIFLLLSLKLYLSWFYAFIALPYEYYYIVPLVVSLVVIAEVWSWRPVYEGFAYIRPLADPADAAT